VVVKVLKPTGQLCIVASCCGRENIVHQSTDVKSGSRDFYEHTTDLNEAIGNT